MYIFQSAHLHIHTCLPDSTTERRLLVLSSIQKTPLETLTYEFNTGTVDISSAWAEYATNGTGWASGAKHEPPAGLGVLLPGNKWFFSIVKESWEQGKDSAPSDTPAAVTAAINKLTQPLERQLFEMH